MSEPLSHLKNEPSRVIYADPAWKFKTRSAKGGARSADRHYSTMTLDDLKALPVGDVAAKDAVLFMWVTDPFLKHGMDVIRAWGFEYVTVGFTWVKHRISTSGEKAEFLGMGYYTRANPEMCLIARRGRPGLPQTRKVRQLIESPIREHSRKPDEVYDRIEAMYGGPYLELFARTTREGWSAWGNEVGKFEAEAVA